MASKSQRLKATVTVGGALSESFKGAMTSSRKQFKRVGGAITQLKDRQKRLNRVADHWDKWGKDASRYRKELARVDKQLGKLQRSQERIGRLRNAREANLAKRGALRGKMFGAVALGATLAAPIAIAAKFQKQMDTVGAISRATSEELGKLTKQARHLGATTQFTAEEAGQGMQYLAMAGYNTEQIMQSMPGLLNLSAAGATDLGRTADIASDVLSGFNLTADQTNRVGDVLTSTFTSSNTNLEMLGDTMSYVAPVAAAANVSLEKTAAMAGELANAGIKGSKAGTALRKIISSLAAPSTKAAKALNKLGVETQDANGDLRDVPSILADMNHAMKGMGTAAKQEIVAAVFGLHAMSGATVLLGKAGSGELQEYTKSLHDTGSAARVAKKQQDNALGALKRLSSAAESMAITIGNVMLPPLAHAADKLAVIIGKAVGVAQKFPVVTKVAVGLTAGLIGLNVAAIAGGWAFTFLKGGVLRVAEAFERLRAGRLLAKVAGGLREARTGMIAFNIAAYANPIGLVVGALVAAGILIYKYWQPIKAFFTGLWSGLEEAAGPVGEAMGRIVDALGPVGTMLKTVGGWIGKVIGWFGSLLQPVDYADDKLKGFQSTGEAVGAAIGGVFTTMAQTVADVVEAIGDKIDWLAKKLQFIGTAYNKVTGAVSSVTESAKSGVGSAWNTVKGWFGGNDDEQKPARRGKPPPPAPSSRTSVQDNSTHTTTIHISQQPGEDSEQLAQRAADEVEKRQRNRQRSALFDRGPAYGY